MLGTRVLSLRLIEPWRRSYRRKTTPLKYSGQFRLKNQPINYWNQFTSLTCPSLLRPVSYIYSPTNLHIFTHQFPDYSLSLVSATFDGVLTGLSSLGQTCACSLRWGLSQVIVWQHLSPLVARLWMPLRVLVPTNW